MNKIDWMRMEFKYRLGFCPHTPLFTFDKMHDKCLYGEDEKEEYNVM